MLNTNKKDLLLIFVSFHSSQDEVSSLEKCLQLLPDNVGYCVVVNEYIPGEPIDDLESQAHFFIRSEFNLGYSKAINLIVSKLTKVPSYLAILNTDIAWYTNIFSQMIDWLNQNPDVNLLVPQILDSSGNIQYLCKRHPTILGMFSRRFFPNFLKNRWILKYDDWYSMRLHDYMQIFDVEYLSGCFMLVRSCAFQNVGGFDERYFLYLEDADFTRSISETGRCIHYPYVSITHNWGRGNYKSLSLMIVNLVSAWKYFTKWGLRIW